MKPIFYMTTLAAIVAGQFAAPHNANAVTITYTQHDTDYTASTLPSSSFNPAWAPSSTDIALQTGEVPDQWRSPFENIDDSAGATPLSDGGYGIGNWGNLIYTSIQGGGTALYNFAPSTGLSILWGSPDSWNTLSFYSGPNGGGNLLGSLTGTGSIPGNLPIEIQTYGHDLVDFTLTGGTFRSVVLSSTTNAFEFADLTATPLPAALPLFVGGLGVIGLLVRRRNRTISSSSPDARRRG